MENELVIGPGEMARIYQALQELASWGPPILWLDEPDQDENGNAIGETVDWFRLTRLFESDFLPRDLLLDLFEEATFVLAARRGLIPISRVLSLDSLTAAERDLIAAVKQPYCEVMEGFYHGVIGASYSEHRCCDWVQENTVVLTESAPDRCFPLELVKLVTFTTEDTLTLEHLPFIEDMFHWAETGPSNHTIKATDEVKFLASVLDQIDRS